MALADIELAIHRLGTEEFIKAGPPKTIVLTPCTEAIVGGTKIFTSGTPRDPQEFKIIFPNVSGAYQNPSIVRDINPDGGVQRFDFILVGKYDAEVDIGDFWKEGDQEYRVEYAFPYNGYEVKVGGVSHGPVA